MLNLPQSKNPHYHAIDDSYTLSIPELLVSNNNKLKIQGYFRLIWPFSSLSIVLTTLYFLSKNDLKTQSLCHEICTYIMVLLIISIHLVFYLLSKTIYQYYYVLYNFDIFLPIIIFYNLLDKKSHIIQWK